MRLRCPECDYPRAVEVKELWEYETDGKSVRVSQNPAGYCVLCPRCDCRYEMTPEGAKRLRVVEKAKPVSVPQRKPVDMLGDLAQPTDEE
ncbi:MAG: hypothetical protein EBT79_05920 [Actinobacteria bacterium]|nr:hypothetical protein [Actinomycetota bacterium]